MQNINDKWVFPTLIQLQLTHPVWKEWWFALVWHYTYIWDNISHQWKSKSASIDWWNISWYIDEQIDIKPFIYSIPQQSKEISYNIDWTVSLISDINWTKSFNYSLWKLINITWTWLYKSKNLIYSWDILTDIVVL